MKAIIAIIIGGPSAAFTLGVILEVSHDKADALKAAAIVFAIICLLIFQLVSDNVFKKPPT